MSLKQDALEAWAIEDAKQKEEEAARNREIAERKAEERKTATQRHLPVLENFFFGRDYTWRLVESKHENRAVFATGVGNDRLEVEVWEDHIIFRDKDGKSQFPDTLSELGRLIQERDERWAQEQANAL